MCQLPGPTVSYQFALLLLVFNGLGRKEG